MTAFMVSERVNARLFGLVFRVLSTHKVRNAGKDYGIFNPRRKSLGKSCVDHPRFKID